MAKIVIAGKSNCPYYARIELLADKMARNLPAFMLHKIVIKENEWQEWLETLCKKNGWQHNSSPLVWREVAERGGKGVLIGGSNEFQEYTCEYYNIKSDLFTNEMKDIAAENCLAKFEEDDELEAWKASIKPLHVCVATASSPIFYSLVYPLLSGEVFNMEDPISLHLLDKEDKLDSLKVVAMEIEDLALGHLHEIIITSNLETAFADCTAIIFLDDIIQKQEETKSQWIKKNANLFVEYGKAIDKVAKKMVRVLVAGNGPINLNTYVLIHHAPTIPWQNFIALARPQENYAKSILARYLNVKSSDTVDVILWGNINSKTMIDISRSRVYNYESAISPPPSISTFIMQHISEKWVNEELTVLVKTERERIQDNLKHPPYSSDAMMILSMMVHWWWGSPSGQIFSIGIYSEGWYNVPEGLVFSFPVIMKGEGAYSVIQDIQVTSEFEEQIKVIVQELEEEKTLWLTEKAASVEEVPKDALEDVEDEESEAEEPLESQDDQAEDSDDQTGDSDAKKVYQSDTAVDDVTAKESEEFPPAEILEQDGEKLLSTEFEDSPTMDRAENSPKESETDMQ